MKHFVVLLSLFIFFGCTSKVTNADLKNLNGYWEIEKVTFPNGETKDFEVNPSIDYIKLDGMKGFRKKMQPKFDGSFTTSNDAEPFTIQVVDQVFEFHYDNEMSKWKEVITALDEDTFSVKNQDAFIYTYKRFESIQISE